MELVFICPDTGQTYQSEKYDIVNHQGVKTDENGDRWLDAGVKPAEKCPFCGRHHIFPARELACPFTPGPGAKGR